MGDHKNAPDTPEPARTARLMNDPLTRDDVEAPRAEFEGRTPQEE
ncbi:MAG TPA: hypothetical protein VHF27_00700 [Acidimicrobiales bacterium]|nr:hypothetical protein [Acidimicrobiales bacterium]